MSKEQESSSGASVIKDEVLEPFFISRDNYCYTVYENIKSSETPGNVYLKTHGHFSDLEPCLKSIAKMKIHKKKEFSSLKEYIGEWVEIQEQFNKQLSVLS
jgi:hypothetical protein